MKIIMNNYPQFQMVSLISVDIWGKERENWVWGGKSPKANEANDANEVL